MNGKESHTENNDPHEGMVAYKLTGMLKDWLEKQSANPDTAGNVRSILETINNYSQQLSIAGKHDKAQAARASHEAIHRVIAAAPEEDKKDIQCKKGCTACCYIEATIVEEEAYLIIDYCNKNNISIDKDYLERQAVRGRREFSEVSKCVFLENNLCSIYEVRPSICRKHFVKTDPGLCDSSKNNDIPLGTYFNLQAEVITSALMNVRGTGPIEKMLLAELEKNN